MKELEKSRRIKEDQGYHEMSRKKSLEEKFLKFVKFVEKSRVLKMIKGSRILRLVEDSRIY